MEIKYLFRLLLISSITFGVSGFVCANTIFIDPNIHNGETITYTSRTGDKRVTIVESVVVKKDGERELY